MDKLFLLLITFILGASPLYAKYESGSNDASSAVIYGKTSGGVLVPLKVSADGTLDTTGGGGGGSSQFITTANVGIGTTDNVGIGTLLPATKLDVIGTLRATTIQAGTGSATISGDSNGNIGLGTVTASNKISIGSTGQNNFDSNGNLGLGTVNPPNKLYAVGTAEVQGFKMGTGAGAGYVLVSSSVGIGTWMTPSSVGAGGGASLWTTGNVGINTTSNVGIGSVNPGKSLDVNGTIRSIVAGDTTLAVGGGNVGIGTATPGQLLDVFCSAGTCMRAVGLGTTVPQQLCITNGKLGYFNGAWASTCTTP